MTHLDPGHTATRRELRDFGLLVGAAFLAISALLYWRSASVVAPLAPAVIGGALILAGAITPGALGTVHSLWMRFAVALSRITTPIFMGTIYFVVLTPTGLIMRALGRNPLGGRRGASRWVARSPGERASVLERQF